MPSESKPGLEALRIAAGFTLALVLAEILELQLTFISPLMAGALLVGAPLAVAQLVALPVIASVSVFLAGFVSQLFQNMPLVLCLCLWGIYLAAFRMSAREATQSIGLMLLVVFAIIPEVMIKAPEAAPDVARWFGANFLVASASVFVMQVIMPRPAGPRELRAIRVPPMPAAAAATTLLLAVLLATKLEPPAIGAALVGVVITLRPDIVQPRQIIRDRLLAALVGGAAAVLAWEMTWLAPSLGVLAASTLLMAWLIARRIVLRDALSGAAAKSLNAFAILVGEGFSVFFDDTDERVWTRIVGVVIGVTYVALALSLRASLARPAIVRSRLYRSGSPGVRRIGVCLPFSICPMSLWP